tara:strand:+ start:90 stop:635 length:546 start_codon:yes stop_codon:yes gene_type:complete
MLILLLLSVNCSEKKQHIEQEIVHQSDKPLNNYLPDVPLNECIHSALYYLESTEINTYDSIDTQYFHEVLGYKNKKAVEMEKRVQILKHSIIIDTIHNLDAADREEIELDIENLRHDLYSFEKEVIGFVFIHTYSIKLDTLSAIIIMTKDCSNSQAIPVNAIKDIEPSNFAYQIQQIGTSI